MMDRLSAPIVLRARLRPVQSRRAFMLAASCCSEQNRPSVMSGPATESGRPPGHVWSGPKRSAERACLVGRLKSAEACLVRPLEIVRVMSGPASAMSGLAPITSGRARPGPASTAGAVARPGMPGFEVLATGPDMFHVWSGSEHVWSGPPGVAGFEAGPARRLPALPGSPRHRGTRSRKFDIGPRWTGARPRRHSARGLWRPT